MSDWSYKVAKRKGRLRRFGRRVGRAIRRTFVNQPRSVFRTEVGIAAVLTPLTTPATAGPSAGGVPAIGYLQDWINGTDPNGLADATTQFIESLKENLFTIAELGAVAGGEAWIAKRTGLDKSTRISKKWSIF